jgi:hypothetical protein
MEAEIANRFSDRRSMASAAELTGGPLGHRSRDLEREKVQREVERRMEREGRLALTRSTLNVSGLTLETRWMHGFGFLYCFPFEDAYNLY